MPPLSDSPLSSIGTRRIALAGKLEHRRTALPGALPGRLELEGPGRARPTEASRPGHAFYAERVVMSGSNDKLAREPCKGSAELAVVFGLIAGDGVKMILAWRRHIDHSSRGENASIGLHNPFRIAATCFSRTQGCRLSVGNPGAALHNPFRGRPVGRAVWICRDACVVSLLHALPDGPDGQGVPLVRRNQAELRDGRSQAERSLGTRAGRNDAPYAPLTTTALACPMRVTLIFRIVLFALGSGSPATTFRLHSGSAFL